MAKWIKTNFPGIRYREHPTRKNGVKRDQYFTIRYKLAGKDREEGLGWASEGWSAVKAYDRLKELKENRKSGEGPQTLAEKREIEQDRREQALAEKETLEKEAITFKQVFEKKYFPVAKENKVRGSWRSEDGIFRNWILPVIGLLPLKTVSPIHLERIKKNMSDAGRAASSIRYALAVIRQVFNFARSIGIFVGDNPVGKVKKPSADNRRLRFLTHSEADTLLEALAKRSIDVHDMALLSLHCGIRSGEAFSLTWGDVDAERGILTFRDTKSGKSRHVFTTDTVKAMFARRPRGKQNDLVFPIHHKKFIAAQKTAPLKLGALRSRTGIQKKVQASKTFNRTVDDLKLNEGVTDRRQKVVWHSLRHTCASWLVESGVDLFVVKEILGHSVIAMTERYSHLSPGTLKNATRTLEKSIKAAKKKRKDGQIVNLK
jgi:integrase